MGRARRLQGGRAWTKGDVYKVLANRDQVPMLLKGLIFGPNGRAMSPSHTKRRGRVHRYYVTREAIAEGYDSCTVMSVSAADVEAAVLAQVQRLLTTPEMIARTWTATRAGWTSARCWAGSPTSAPCGPSCSRPSRRGS